MLIIPYGFDPGYVRPKNLKEFCQDTIRKDRVDFKVVERSSTVELVFQAMGVVDKYRGQTQEQIYRKLSEMAKLVN
jgi:hypothetical protein